MALRGMSGPVNLGKSCLPHQSPCIARQMTGSFPTKIQQFAAFCSQRHDFHRYLLLAMESFWPNRARFESQSFGPEDATPSQGISMHRSFEYLHTGKVDRKPTMSLQKLCRTLKVECTDLSPDAQARDDMGSMLEHQLSNQYAVQTYPYIGYQFDVHKNMRP